MEYMPTLTPLAPPLAVRHRHRLTWSGTWLSTLQVWQRRRESCLFRRVGVFRERRTKPFRAECSSEVNCALQTTAGVHPVSIDLLLLLVGSLIEGMPPQSCTTNRIQQDPYGTQSTPQSCSLHSGGHRCNHVAMCRIPSGLVDDGGPGAQALEGSRRVAGERSLARAPC